MLANSGGETVGGLSLVGVGTPPRANSEGKGLSPTREQPRGRCLQLLAIGRWERPIGGWGGAEIGRANGRSPLFSTVTVQASSQPPLCALRSCPRGRSASCWAAVGPTPIAPGHRYVNFCNSGLSFPVRPAFVPNSHP